MTETLTAELITALGHYWPLLIVFVFAIFIAILSDPAKGQQ